MDPSSNACIEVLRPRSVPEGLVALGTVIEISQVQLKLQITGGLMCLVDRFNINQVYSGLIEKHGGSYETAQKISKLSQLFKRGQQYICKIIERRPRKGYPDALDIIATLDPSSIQEDNLPKTFFAIPQMPLQCVIQSVEDHGYQTDLGFTNLTGFLAFNDAEAYCEKYNDGKRLSIGQVIRCCTKSQVSDEAETRVIHLTLEKEHLKNSVFTKDKVSGNTLTDRCILPGSRSFLTVMKVQKDGLIVNFMNEYAGFVGINHLRNDWHHPREDYKIADQFECQVLYYNHITKTFSLSIRRKSTAKTNLKYFLENYHVGQIVKDASVAYIDNLKSVYFKLDNGHKAVANVKDALNCDLDTMTKDEQCLELNSAFPTGSTHKCRIKSINLADLMVVLSLRDEFLELPFVSVEELSPADFVEVTIKKYVKDGIVVTFGLNLRAIILNIHLQEYVSPKSYKKYPLGKVIKCRVLKVDLSKQPPRVYLTNKEQLMDPQLNIIDYYDSSCKAKPTQATIIKIKPDGLIVEFFNDVKGYIPRRFLSSVVIKKLDDLYKIGQVTPCTVYRVNVARQSLSLGVIPMEKIKEFKKGKKSVDKKRKMADKLAKEQNRIEKSITTAKLNSRKSISTSILPTKIKSRLQRSEEAKLREEKLREAERKLLDPDRSPQSIPDFERLLLKTPNSADAWTKYSKFFLDNVETEKARIVCRRALKTINFRLEGEKLKIWLYLIKIEAKFGGSEKLKEVIEEAVRTTDQIKLYQGATKVLTSCGELDEAERLFELMFKIDGRSLDVWLEFIQFYMEHKKDLVKARNLFDKACKHLLKSDLVTLKSRFAQFEFKYGDVERGKTMFENLLSDNPKRVDLWRVFEGMVRKFGNRHEETLKRIAESIAMVSKARKKVVSVK